jgi:hypothetical protein
MNKALKFMKAIWALLMAPMIVKPITWDEANWLAENVKYGGLI